MDLEEALWLLRNYRNPLVRQAPVSRGGHCNGNWMVARLVSISGDNEHAFIIPRGHKQEEKVELKYLKKWNSKLHEMGVVDNPEPPPSRTPLREKPLAAKLGDFMPPLEDKPKDEKKVNYQERFKPLPEELKTEVRRLREMGKSYKEIVEISGVRHGSIHQIINGKKKVEKPKAKPKTESVSKPSEGVLVTTLPYTSPPPNSSFYPSPRLDTSPDEKIKAAIRNIIHLPIADTAKLMAIEALIS